MEKTAKGVRIQAKLSGEAAYIFNCEQKRTGESQSITLKFLLRELVDLREYKKNAEKKP